MEDKSSPTFLEEFGQHFHYISCIFPVPMFLFLSSFPFPVPQSHTPLLPGRKFYVCIYFHKAVNKNRWSERINACMYANMGWMKTVKCPGHLAQGLVFYSESSDRHHSFQSGEQRWGLYLMKNTCASAEGGLGETGKV